jgi:Predicted ATPase (AAA+ superfamily)
MNILQSLLCKVDNYNYLCLDNKRKFMEAFYRTHSYLVEHTNTSVRRDLMDEIDWNDRLIGIKGTRGVGKTTFLLQYAKERFGTDRSCLFINMNNFYFSGHTIIEFAEEFLKNGGKVLLIDQVFKYPNWSHELRICHDRFPGLKIVFSGSSVMRLKEENTELSGIVKSYNLRGFSFREFLNLQTGNSFPSYSFRRDFVQS